MNRFNGITFIPNFVNIKKLAQLLKWEREQSSARLATITQLQRGNGMNLLCFVFNIAFIRYFRCSYMHRFYHSTIALQ
jgi:hypothetical protein